MWLSRGENLLKKYLQWVFEMSQILSSWKKNEERNEDTSKEERKPEAKLWAVVTMGHARASTQTGLRAMQDSEGEVLGSRLVEVVESQHELVDTGRLWLKGKR